MPAFQTPEDEEFARSCCGDAAAADYAAASFDHSTSMNPPSPPLPVYHFQHIARRNEHQRTERFKALANTRR
jgi:hypothetical protein